MDRERSARSGAGAAQETKGSVRGAHAEEDPMRTEATLGKWEKPSSWWDELRAEDGGGEAGESVQSDSGSVDQCGAVILHSAGAACG